MGIPICPFTNICLLVSGKRSRSYCRNKMSEAVQVNTNHSPATEHPLNNRRATSHERIQDPVIASREELNYCSSDLGGKASGVEVEAVGRASGIGGAIQRVSQTGDAGRVHSPQGSLRSQSRKW